jgi:hypothetical protein
LHVRIGKNIFRFYIKYDFIHWDSPYRLSPDASNKMPHFCGIVFN